MGVRTSFPLAQSPVVYKKTFEYDASGTKAIPLHTRERNRFEKATSQLFEGIVNGRITLQHAKRKFREFNSDDMRRGFPKWEPNQLMEFKSQFLMFDLNQDGLIDFEELNEVLIDLGDGSTEEERRAYFDEYDEDGSGQIDFEEFLGLVYRVQFDDKGSFAEICKQTADESQRVKRLSIVDQMHHGIF